MSTPRLSPSESADNIINELIAVQPTEFVAIVSDDESPIEMVTALADAVRNVGAEYAILQQPARAPENKNYLNPTIEKGLEAADILIGITMTSGAPVYAAKVKELLKAKTLRVMSLAMRDLDTLTAGGATADYKAVRADGEKLAKIWSEGSIMRITSAAGTDISAPIASDEAIIECGYVHEAGFMAGCPDGEVSSRPVEGTANGVFVVDGPAAVVGKPDTPIRISVTDGKVTAIEGDSPQAEQFRSIVATVENADHVAEFGIGLNPASRPDGRFQEGKKRRGQVHIALGDNIYYGGTVKSNVHMDLVVTDPTVTLDGRTLVDQGRVILD